MSVRDLDKQLQKAAHRLRNAGNLGREERISVSILIEQAREALAAREGV